MKRFMIDSMLIFLLVILGSSYMEDDQKDIVYKIDKFEDKIENNILYEDTSMNKATLFAKSSSDVIENVVGISVELISRFFSAIIE